MVPAMTVPSLHILCRNRCRDRINCLPECVVNAAIFGLKLHVDTITIGAQPRFDIRKRQLVIIVGFRKNLGHQVSNCT